MNGCLMYTLHILNVNVSVPRISSMLSKTRYDNKEYFINGMILLKIQITLRLRSRSAEH